MSEENQHTLKIRIPEGFLVPRLYLYSFLNIVEASKKEVGQYVILRNGDVFEAIIEGMEIVKEVIENRRKDDLLRKLRLDTLPMSGNDKRIFMKLCSELSCELDPAKILEAYIDVLRSRGISRLKEGLERFDIGAEGYSLPSIFKLELYGLTRGSFFRDGFSIDSMMRVSSDFFVLMLAGYLLSRVGRARIDGRTWVSVHVVPSELAWSRSSWRELQNMLSGLWHGIRPADALTLHLLINLWNLLKGEPHNLIIFGVIDPAGSKPATVSISVDAPLKDVCMRAGELLDHLLDREWSRNALSQLVRKALDPNQAGKEIAERLVKLLFLSLQGDVRALEELSLLSSRLEIAASTIKQPKDLEREILNMARDARRLARELLTYRRI